MKLNPGKYDDKMNKIRIGSAFVGTRTDNLKYIDKDGAEAELVPVSRYYASTTILRGQPVSIAQLAKLSKAQADDEFAYVKVTDPDVDESCLGLALNYAEEGQIVQVQRYGKFSFLTTKSQKYKDQSAEGNLKEVFVNADNGFLFDKVRGQKLFIKKLGCEDFDNLHPEKDHEHLPSGDHEGITIKDTASAITYDFIDSAYTAKNTIQIGQLTDAPTTGTEKDQEVTIELDVTGDTRGPIDHTQFIVTLGEDIEFSSGNAEANLTEPYNDEGIYNEVKVVALATHGPEKSQFAITPRTIKVTTLGDNTSFIGVRKLGGSSVIIPFSKVDSFEDLCNMQTGASDIGYLKLLKSSYNSDQKAPTILEPLKLDPEKSYTEVIEGKILEALQALDVDTFGKAVVTKSDKIIDTDTTIEEYQITAAVAGGYFDIYESENLVKYFITKTLNHGSQAEAGTAILADIRDANRTNVIGVVVSNQAGIHHAGETIKVMRAGRFLTTGKLKVGAEYFLGLNGRITTRNQYWYDTNVKIGTVENERNLIVNVQEMQHDFTGNLPIGYMKECKGGVPERGFVLADGETYYDIEKYEDLYNTLLDYYTPEELACYIKNADGTLTEEIDAKHFIIPKVTMNNGVTVAQVKYTPSGLYHNLPRAPFLRFSGKISEDGKIEPRDVTRLVHYGTLEQSRVAPTLENIEVRLFVREPDNKLFPAGSEYADKYIWREMAPGFQVYNNDTVYGFDWVVKQNDYEGTDGVYVLEIQTNQGLGICKISAQGQPIPLKGAEYKLIVTGKNLWTREYSLLENSDVADSMELSTDDLAPSVNAIKKYYEEKVATKRLEAGNGEFYSDENGTHAGNLDVDNIKVKDKTIVYYEDDAYNKHLKTLATDVETTTDENDQPTTIKGVHGMYNKGVEGNLDAAKVGGLKLGDGKDSITENFDEKSKSYIPYVNREGSSQATEFNAGTTYNAMTKDGDVLYTEKGFYAENDNTTFKNTKEVKPEGIKSLVNETSFADTTITEKITASDTEIKVNVNGNGKDVKVSGIKELEVTGGIKVGNTVIPESYLATQGGTASSIAFKTVKNEKIDKTIKSKLDAVLTPNTEVDANGNSTEALDTSKLGEELSHAGTKLGSALQALYEMPLSVFDYNYGGDKYKEQLGILIERINQVRDVLKDPNNEVLKNFAHKRNTLVKTDVSSISGASDGADKLYDGKTSLSKRPVYNDYQYTEAEAKSIAAYLDLVTNKQELAQELRSTVTILMAAAQETQERLLNVETSVFGFDAPSVPGKDDESKEKVEKLIDKNLREAINSSPLLLGLNRLMRALCLEIYNTTDLEAISAETESVLADSDTLKDKITVATRIDEVDRIVSDLMYRINGLTRLEKYSDLNIETHNYENLTDSFADNLTDSTGTHVSIEQVSDTEKRTGQVDSTGTWKTLPSKEDYENITAEFAVSSTDKLHSPNSYECGVVQTPITEVVEVITREPGEDGIYKDHTYEIEKPVYDPKTGLPVYKEQGVAFLDAKVERINKKLSAVTETIYGEDSVLAKFPNRTEVIRRNITNLIDDLYPNRDFAIEVLDNSSKLYRPFEESANISTGSKNAEGSIVKDKMGDAIDTNQKESIIVPLVKTLYNFTSKQNFLTNVTSSTKEPLVKRPNTPEVLAGTAIDTIYWDSKKLKPVDFETATNQIEWIKKTLGIEDTLSNDYLYNKLFLDLNLSTNAKKAKANTYSVYKENLKFWVDGESKTNTPVEEIGNATNVGAMISRKANPIEHRISMLEAAMDDFTNWTAYVKKFTDDQKTSQMSGHNAANGRYEEEPFTDNLQGLVNAMAHRYNDMFLFPEDMAIRSYWENDSVTSEKNRAIVNEIDKLYKVTKIVTSTEGSNYDIYVKKTLNNTDLSNSAIESDGYKEAIVHVVYVKPNKEGACDLKAGNTIYLHVDNSVNTEWAHTEGNVDNVGDMGIKSDFSHRMIMETMKAVAKDIAQTQFDHDNPIGAIKVERLRAEADFPEKPTFGANPYDIKEGTWNLIKASYMAAADSTLRDDGKLKTALPDNLKIASGRLGGDDGAILYTYGYVQDNSRPLDPKPYVKHAHMDREISVKDFEVTTLDTITNIEADNHPADIVAKYTDEIKDLAITMEYPGEYTITTTTDGNWEVTGDPETVTTAKGWDGDTTLKVGDVITKDSGFATKYYKDPSCQYVVVSVESSEERESDTVSYTKYTFKLAKQVKSSPIITTIDGYAWDEASVRLQLQSNQTLEWLKDSEVVDLTGADLEAMAGSIGYDTKVYRDCPIEFKASITEKAGDLPGEAVYTGFTPSADPVIKDESLNERDISVTASSTITDFEMSTNIRYVDVTRLLYWERVG